MQDDKQKEISCIITLHLLPEEYKLQEAISENDTQKYVNTRIKKSLSRMASLQRLRHKEEHERVEREIYQKDIEILDMPAKVKQHMKSNDIHTIGDLLNDSLGIFTYFTGIGSRGQAKLTRQLTNMGLNMQKYIGSLLHDRQVPSTLIDLIQAYKIQTIEQLEEISKLSIYQFCCNDYEMTQRIVLLLRECGLHIREPEEALTMDIMELSTRLRYALIRAGHHTESSILSLSDDGLWMIPGIGEKTAREFTEWRKRRS